MLWPAEAVRAYTSNVATVPFMRIGLAEFTVTGLLAKATHDASFASNPLLVQTTVY